MAGMISFDLDAQRDLLSVLTAACHDMRFGQGASPLLAELFPSEGGGAGPDLMGEYTLNTSVPLPATEADINALVQTVTDTVVVPLQRRMFSMIGYALLIFSDLAREAHEHGLDVDGFLQRAALELEAAEQQP